MKKYTIYIGKTKKEVPEDMIIGLFPNKITGGQSENVDLRQLVYGMTNEELKVEHEVNSSLGRGNDMSIFKGQKLGTGKEKDINIDNDIIDGNNKLFRPKMTR